MIVAGSIRLFYTVSCNNYLIKVIVANVVAQLMAMYNQ